ncbi:hypothetical protein U0070_027077 [Myodes glareolus]|uniref:G-protein coupled receptors family 1 profile domain-containing protein n=1 Tax=Myodes glareolus TaxID=447135 RepID=A0AAW0GZ70_MYOGA
MLFGIFLLMYLTILMCNSTIMLITRIDPALQIPIYFFLSNLSFVEICYVTATIPRMLMDLCTQKGTIPLFSCAVQLCFVIMLGGMECLLLTVMAYDRYLACGDTFVNNLAVYVAAVAFVMVPFLLIIVSYGKIICNILKLSSAGGRSKAFSTCSSHLIVAVLFYGTATITYAQPKSNRSESMGKLLSLFYTILIPLLNPIIYTLRNKDIMVALGKLQTKLSIYGNS